MHLKLLITSILLTMLTPAKQESDTIGSSPEIDQQLKDFKGKFGITASITQGPSNAVAEIGNQIKLTCIADAPIDSWFLSKDGTATGELRIIGPGCLTVNVPFGDHYSVESIGGGTTCNLIVFNITMEQAGVYRCSEAQNNMTLFSILTVIDSPPVITVNSRTTVVENEKVIIGCSLDYNGSLAPAPTLRPYFYWTNINGQNVSSSNDSTTENTAVSQLTVRAGRQNIAPYTCHVQLQLSPPATSYYANNTPSVNSSASSPSIEVLYKVVAYGWSSHSQYIAIGGITCEVKVVTCLATGNPAPHFKWLDIKGNVSISNEATFDLAEINRKYTCIASNTIRNEVYHDSFSYLQQDGSSSVIQDCRFPRTESTLIVGTPIEGCEGGTCSCEYDDYDRFTLECNVESYPYALFQWIGADGCVVKSQVYASAQINGMYRCNAYFDRSSSNYTGNAGFPNGISEINVIQCSGEISSTCPVEVTDSDNSDDVAIAMGVLFGISFAVNITILVIWLVKHLRAK